MDLSQKIGHAMIAFAFTMFLLAVFTSAENSKKNKASAYIFWSCFVAIAVFLLLP